MWFADPSRRLVHRRSEYTSESYIGKMPNNVITNILNRLPLKEAVSTSILASEWRFKWCLLTDVIVDDDFFYFLTNKFDGKDITRLLMHLIVPIRRFVFSVEPKSVCGLVHLNYEEIGEWLLLLFSKGIEELTIRNWYDEHVTLPRQVYSVSDLKHLELHHCKFPNLDNSSIFPKLLRLELLYVTFQSGTFWEFIRLCPLVEFLKVNVATTKEMRLMEIAKLQNIIKLHLSLGVSNKHTTITVSNLLHLANLPKLATLTLDFANCKVLLEGNSNTNLSIAFVSLISLNLNGVDFGDNVMVSFIIGMLRGSPNLQMLETRASDELSDLPFEVAAIDAESNTVWLSQLQRVVFQSFPRSHNELSLIKFILACSPFLKNVFIRVSNSSYDEPENIKVNWSLARKLLKLHRASKTTGIDFFWCNLFIHIVPQCVLFLLSMVNLIYLNKY